jgi:hypothetical protein
MTKRILKILAAIVLVILSYTMIGMGWAGSSYPAGVNTILFLSGICLFLATIIYCLIKAFK